MEQEVILSVKDLNVKFSLRGQVLHAIRGISLDIYKGESLAIVGESGSGKSVFTKNFIGLLDKNGWVDSGEIWYNGMDLAKFKTEKEWANIRGKEVAMVMQDPMTSLNPLKTIGWQIEEAIKLHQGISGEDAKKRAIEIIDDVGIPEPERRYKQYPHEFSGGMRQRVVIAIAMACNPKILICDEPTTALDVTIQAQILNLIRALQKKYQLTTIYITHDLGVVANVADRIAVMYAGDIVEIGTCNEVFYSPQHPYTWALLSSLPQLGVKGQDLIPSKVHRRTCSIKCAVMPLRRAIRRPLRSISCIGRHILRFLPRTRRVPGCLIPARPRWSHQSTSRIFAISVQSRKGVRNNGT